MKNVRMAGVAFFLLMMQLVCLSVKADNKADYLKLAQKVPPRSRRRRCGHCHPRCRRMPHCRGRAARRNLSRPHPTWPARRRRDRRPA